MYSSGLSSESPDKETAPLQIITKNNVAAEKKQTKSNTLKISIRRHFHILVWIKKYNRNSAIADFIAGVTLGLTIIPQSLAYASLAGLSSHYGLYSSFAGSFVYVIFGTIPQVSIGPTSLMALLTLKYTMDMPIEFTIILAFLSGVVELAMGILNLGFIVRFISHPVTSAFTTATSGIIILTQFKNLMGIKTKNNEMRLMQIAKEATPGDCILGLTGIGILIMLRQLNSLQFATNTSAKQILKKCLWYISISRNAIVVFYSSLLAYNLASSNGSQAVPFALCKSINSTNPSIRIPPFYIEHENVAYSFIDICNKLGSGILVVPIVAVLANVAIAKAFVKDSTLDASQEMMALGICNIAGSLFSSMPTCGAFTRSAVSETSGVKTPMAGIYTGGIVLLALKSITPYIEYIPRSTLSAVLITAVLFMIDAKTLKELWKKNKTNFWNWVGVFVVCIKFGVEIGLLFGIIVNLSLVMISLSKPKINALLRNIEGCDFIHITPCVEIYYIGADHLRDIIKSICAEHNFMYPVVIDCQKIAKCDYTLLQVLKTIIRELEDKNVQVYLQSLQQETRTFLCESKNNIIFCNTEMEFYMSITEKSLKK